MAFCKVQFFFSSKNWIPAQGTDFMSTLFKTAGVPAAGDCVCKLLIIIHRQTNREVQTLKQMLHKFVNETNSDWVQWCPVLSLRGSSPHGSSCLNCYCHKVRGLLVLLRDQLLMFLRCTDEREAMAQQHLPSSVRKHDKSASVQKVVLSPFSASSLSFCPSGQNSVDLPSC